MSDKFLKNKVMISVIIGLLVVVLALVIVIFVINKEDISQMGDNETSDILTEITNIENNDVNSNESESPTSTIESEDNDVSGDLNASDTSMEKHTGKDDSDESNTDKTIIVTLGEYRGIVPEYKPEMVSDETIDTMLKKLQSDNTEIVNLPDRPFEKGDMAIVSFWGKVEDSRIDELSGVCLQVIVGSGTMFEKIEDEIVGKRIGDMFHVDIDYPESYTAIPAVSGKTVDFTIELVDGFMFEKPEITDEFISKVTEYKTIDEYKTKEKEKLQKEADDKAYREMLIDLKRKVVENCTFSGPIDSGINEQYVLKLKSENDTYMEQYYMDAATYYSLVYGMTQEEYQDSLMDEIELQVKYDYVLEEIAKQEGISKEEAEKLVTESAVIPEK